MGFIQSIKNSSKNVWTWVILTAFVIVAVIWIAKACEHKSVLDPPAKETDDTSLVSEL